MKPTPAISNSAISLYAAVAQARDPGLYGCATYGRTVLWAEDWRGAHYPQRGWDRDRRCTAVAHYFAPPAGHAGVHRHQAHRLRHGDFQGRSPAHATGAENRIISSRAGAFPRLR